MRWLGRRRIRSVELAYRRGQVDMLSQVSNRLGLLADVFADEVGEEFQLSHIQAEGWYRNFGYHVSARLMTQVATSFWVLYELEGIKLVTDEVHGSNV